MVMEFRKSCFSSASLAGRGESLVTRCCTIVPATSASASSGAYPTAFSPLGMPVCRMRAMIAPARISPASSGTRFGNVRPHQPGGLQVPMGIGLRGEAENRGGVQDHRHPMRNQRPPGAVPRRDKVPDHPRDRVRHAVGQVHARVAESDAGEGRRQEHRSACLVIRRVSRRPDQIARDHLDRPPGPDVADRVGPLVRRPLGGTVRGGPLAKRQGGQRFDGMAQNVQSRARGDLRRHASGIVRINHSQHRPQCAVRDARLGVQRGVIEDRHAGRLASRPRRGRHRDQRLQFPWDREAPSPPAD